MEKWLTRIWYGEASGGIWLRPLSWLYAAILAVRRWAYGAGLLKSYRIAKPVIVVGNLTVGGTGKTPLVIWLAQQLSARGLKVAIVSRGYGSKSGPPREVSPAVSHFGGEGGTPHASLPSSASWREVGDEPVLISRRSGCRVFVSADRVAAAQVAVQSGADVVISDDGLQHLRLMRDCEIVVIDGARGLGNQRLLPAGPLREPARRLASVDLIVMNGSTTAKRAIPWGERHIPLTMGLRPVRVQPILDLGLHAGRPLDAFRGQLVHAVAGIGNPNRFFDMLRSHGIDVIEHAFPDHHPFAPNELIFADDLPVLLTEKDAVRAASFANDRMSFVPVDAELSEADAQRLLGVVDHALNASKPTTR
jgi:tetraacyldisaccharide 4'-kinase